MREPSKDKTRGYSSPHGKVRDYFIGSGNIHIWVIWPDSWTWAIVIHNRDSIIRPKDRF